MAETRGTLIQLLLILFVFDIVRKFYFKPKDINKDYINNKNDLGKKDKNKIETNSELDLSNNYKYDDEFISNKNTVAINDTNYEENIENNEKKKNNIKILIINYDKFLYEKNFLKIKNELENNYTNIFVDGKEYPIPENKKLFSKFTYITQIGVSLLLFFTKSLKLGLPFLSDNTIKIIEDYKWLIIIGNFIIHYWLNKYLVTSGAFEIMYNNKLLYSKLKTHILPKELDLKKLIKTLNIKQKVEEDF